MEQTRRLLGVACLVLYAMCILAHLPLGEAVEGKTELALQVHNEPEQQQQPDQQQAGQQQEGQAAPTEQLVGQCEVCVYVVENKEQHQPYLCRGLKDPSYQVCGRRDEVVFSFSLFTICPVSWVLVIVSRKR